MMCVGEAGSIYQDSVKTQCDVHNHYVIASLCDTTIFKPGQRLTNCLYKEPDSKYLRLCRSQRASVQCFSSPIFYFLKNNP